MKDQAGPVVPVRARGAYRQSALVLGTAQLGGAYGIANRTGVPDDGATARMLTTAQELGVTHLDTARAYGDSERRVGAALPGLDLAVITKIGPGAPVRESLAASREALGITGPLTVLLHRAADAAAGWSDLRRCLETGEADRVGVSVQSPDELRQVLRLPDLGYVQLPCNILDRRWLSAFPDFSEDHPDLVVTVRSAYLQGLLAAGSSVTWPHLPDAERDAVVATLDRLAAEFGRQDRRDLCLAYLLSLPWVTSLVVGAETEEQLRGNADLISRKPLTEAEREQALAELPEMPVELLDPSRWNA
ncbi:aldo/keto reductase [Actinoplanes sp. M2I2]|uniref:aldo/keto reductase n=1 Tax=Actinoplanes sp. M2I2 TaxID=1734444 RepID=UPI002021BDFC|nr:aldo/keto reductase [Actinoplanes sp. M2I2]